MLGGSCLTQENQIYLETPPDPPPKTVRPISNGNLSTVTKPNLPYLDLLPGRSPGPKRLPPDGSLYETTIQIPIDTAKQARASRSALVDIVKNEFDALQCDTLLSPKHVFDLVEYCILLLEKAMLEQSSAKCLRIYIRAYLILNYTINSFIMFHYNGFLPFLQQSKKDFFIYLNLYNFLQSKELFTASKLGVDPALVRERAIFYLESENKLMYNLSDLSKWLDTYVDYLQKLEESGGNNVDFSSNQTQEVAWESSDDSDDYFHSPSLPPNKNNTGLDADSLFDEVSDFGTRFPEVSLKLSGSKKNSGLEKDPKNPAGGQTPYPVNSQVFEEALATLDPLKNGSTSLSTSTSSSGFRTALVEVDNMDSSTRGLSSRLTIEPPMANGHMGLQRQQLYTSRAGNSRKLDPPTLTSLPGQSLSRPHTIADGTLGKNYNVQVNSWPDQSARSQMTEQQRQQFQEQQKYDFIQQQRQQQQRPQQQLHYPSQKQFPGNYQYQTPLYAGPFSNRSSTVQSYENYQPHDVVPVMQNGYFSNMLPLHGGNGYYQHNQMPIYETNYPSQQVYHRSMRESIYNACGLKNYGSTCYINLTVQVLAGISDFLRILAICSKSARGDSLTGAMLTLLALFRSQSGMRIGPSSFIQVVKNMKPDFQIPSEQQDAQELLIFFLDKLHEENCHHPIKEEVDYLKTWKITVRELDREEYLKWYKALVEKEKRSPINDMFQGHVQNKLKCNQCGHQSVRYDSFTILSLPIPHTSMREVDLTDCLRYYSLEEVLSGENAWDCPKCNKKEPSKEPAQPKENPMDVVFVQKRAIFRFSKRSKSPSKKSKSERTAADVSKVPTLPKISIKLLSFIKLPPVLFIQLSRFSMIGETDKLNTEIVFPLQLPFQNGSHSIMYNLVGCINHFGTLKSGHYTAHVNKALCDPQQFPNGATNPVWYNFDDERVRPIQLHVCGNGRSFCLKDVYVLCYQRN